MDFRRIHINRVAPSFEAEAKKNPTGYKSFLQNSRQTNKQRCRRRRCRHCHVWHREPINTREIVQSQWKKNFAGIKETKKLNTKNEWPTDRLTSSIFIFIHFVNGVVLNFILLYIYREFQHYAWSDWMLRQRRIKTGEQRTVVKCLEHCEWRLFYQNHISRVSVWWLVVGHWAVDTLIVRNWIG